MGSFDREFAIESNGTIYFFIKPLEYHIIQLGELVQRKTWCLPGLRTSGWPLLPFPPASRRGPVHLPRLNSLSPTLDVRDPSLPELPFYSCLLAYFITLYYILSRNFTVLLYGLITDAPDMEYGQLPELGSYTDSEQQAMTGTAHVTVPELTAEGPVFRSVAILPETPCSPAVPSVAARRTRAQASRLVAASRAVSASMAMVSRLPSWAIVEDADGKPQFDVLSLLAPTTAPQLDTTSEVEEQGNSAGDTAPLVPVPRSPQPAAPAACAARDTELHSQDMPGATKRARLHKQSSEAGSPADKVEPDGAAGRAGSSYSNASPPGSPGEMDNMWHATAPLLATSTSVPGSTAHGCGYADSDAETVAAATACKSPHVVGSLPAVHTPPCSAMVCGYHASPPRTVACKRASTSAVGAKRRRARAMSTLRLPEAYSSVAENASV